MCGCFSFIDSFRFWKKKPIVYAEIHHEEKESQLFYTFLHFKCRPSRSASLNVIR